MNIVQIIYGIIGFVLAAGGLVGFIWAMVGVSVGVVLLLIYLSKKKRDNKTLRKKLIFAFGGFPLLILVFILYAIVNFLFTLFGVEAGINVPIT